MTERTCSTAGCNKPVKARGWCVAHYSRERRAGRIQPKTLEERFQAKTEPAGECTAWTGSRNKDGYGAFNFNGKTTLAHRAAWTLAGRPLPDTKQIDHSCGNAWCVNLDHLRIATHKQNQENLSAAGRGGKSGVRGVYWHKANRKWVAQVRHNKTTHYLGQFEDLDDAAAAARAKRNELFTFNERDRGHKETA